MNIVKLFVFEADVGMILLCPFVHETIVDERRLFLSTISVWYMLVLDVDDEADF